MAPSHMPQQSAILASKAPAATRLPSPSHIPESPYPHVPPSTSTFTSSRAQTTQIHSPNHAAPSKAPGSTQAPSASRVPVSHLPAPSGLGPSKVPGASHLPSSSRMPAPSRAPGGASQAPATSRMPAPSVLGPSKVPGASHLPGFSRMPATSRIPGGTVRGPTQLGGLTVAGTSLGRDHVAGTSLGRDTPREPTRQPTIVSPPPIKSVAPVGLKSVFKTQRDVIMASRQTRFDTLSPKDKQEQEAWAQSMIKNGPCPEGYDWDRIDQGYRCRGGGHAVTDEQLSEGKGGLWGIVNGEWEGPYYPHPTKPGEWCRKKVEK